MATEVRDWVDDFAATADWVMGSAGSRETLEGLLQLVLGYRLYAAGQLPLIRKLLPLIPRIQERLRPIEHSDARKVYREVSSGLEEAEDDPRTLRDALWLRRRRDLLTVPYYVVAVFEEVNGVTYEAFVEATLARSERLDALASVGSAR